MLWIIVLGVVAVLMFVLFGKRGIQVPRDVSSAGSREAPRDAAEQQLERELDNGRGN